MPGAPPRLPRLLAQPMWCPRHPHVQPPAGQPAPETRVPSSSGHTCAGAPACPHSTSAPALTSWRRFGSVWSSENGPGRATIPQSSRSSSSSSSSSCSPPLLSWATREEKWTAALFMTMCVLEATCRWGRLWVWGVQRELVASLTVERGQQYTAAKTTRQLAHVSSPQAGP